MNLQSHRRAKNRACFVLKVKSQLLPEFLAAHRSVWPEYLLAFQDAGIDSYTSFVSSDGLFVGYLEAENPAGALAALAADTSAEVVGAMCQPRSSPLRASIDDMGRMMNSSY